MKKLLIALSCIFRLVSGPQTASGQQTVLDYEKTLGALREWSKSIVAVEVLRGTQGDSTNPRGSGVLVGLPFDDRVDHGVVVLITARHLFERDPFKLSSFQPAPAAVTFNTNSGVKGTRRYVPMGVYKSADLMVMKAEPDQPSLLGFTFMPIPLQQISLPESIMVGQHTFIAGFPLRWGIHPGRITPVVKSGVVAMVTPETILVDAAVSPGNSGGGVFTIGVHGDLQLAGILMGYPKSNEYVVRGFKSDCLCSPIYEQGNSAMGVVVPLTRLRHDRSKIIRAVSLQFYE